jgi:hypothetical protein
MSLKIVSKAKNPKQKLKILILFLFGNAENLGWWGSVNQEKPLAFKTI